MLWHVVRAWIKGERVCIVDVPLLVESNLWRLVGSVVVVYWCVQYVANGNELTVYAAPAIYSSNGL